MMAILISILVFGYSLGAFAFNLRDVKVNCESSPICEQRIARFKELIGEYRSLIHLKDTLKVMASDGGYQSFSYALDKSSDDYYLSIDLKLKPIISEINIGFLDRNIEYDPSLLIDMKEGEFFEVQKLKENLGFLTKRLESMGFPDNSHTYSFKEKSGNVEVNIVVTLGQPRIFKRVKVKTNSPFLSSYLHNKFLHLYNKPFDQNKFKIYLDEAQKELFGYGYYLLSFQFAPVYKMRRVYLEINCEHDSLFAFDLKNLQREHREIVHGLLIDLFRKYKKALTPSTIKNALTEHYKHKALLKSKFVVETSEFKNKLNETVYLYRVYFYEDGKTRVVDLHFNGNSYFTTEKLERMYRREAFELASINYFDEEYYSYFQEYLRVEYVKKGFTLVKILDPTYKFDSNKTTSKVEYNIQEGPRSFIRKIEILGIPQDLESQAFDQIKNKINKPFNPIQLTEDIKTLSSFLQENGYYYAELTNINDADFVTYNKSGSDVTLKFKVNSGPLVRLNRVLYLGNNKTRKKVIAKKVSLKKGDLITPNKTRDIESSLSATGLFNSVTVTPVRHNSKNAATDLIVKVVERDYGLIEIAPGYRTDLGLKLTGTVTYQNIGGYYKSVSLRSQLNRRTSFTTIDPERRDKIEHILEHNTSITYNQGDIFDTLIDGSASAAYQTRRFYKFDANIFRVNGTLSRDLARNLSSSVRYQYEDITQYSATDEINNGSFQIGSITPSLIYDLRNSQVNATKGAYFNLSCEFANPYFFSQKEPDLTINYYKLVSRNRFYIPFKNGTLAISMAGGIQENLATETKTVNGVEQTEGYIPTIKVFRLTGMDIVRGFTDEEMNRLPDGQDISDVRISQKAYMANLKIEPRYFLNDALMAGVFYDAGRVFANQLDLGELRDSAGITFKIVTPVGTLDFDYGIKLLRKRDPNGRLEDPGRFHVSIGFF